MSKPVSCIDLMKIIDDDDSSEESVQEKPKQEEVAEITNVNYKQYLTSTTENVHKNLQALENNQKQLNVLTTENIPTRSRCECHRILLKDENRHCKTHDSYWTA